MDGQTVQAEGDSTIIDKGSGEAAYDGQNVILGQASLSWAVALRFVIGSYAFAGGYDANGNLTSRVVDGVAYLFAYDEENHLTGVSGAATATFVCDGDGARKNTCTTAKPCGQHHDDEEVLLCRRGQGMSLVQMGRFYSMWTYLFYRKIFQRAEKVGVL